MGRSLDLDLSELFGMIANAPEAAARGARQAMDDIKDDWVRESRDRAPLDSGNLRRQISGEVKGEGFNSSVIVTANASQNGFNYGYFIHEKDAGGKQLKLAGAEKKFFDVSAEENDEKWKRWLESEIKEELNRAGW